ncbi:hypothetical protein [Massilia antarctica]|uniref:hypothetical protein n=1 Tax=Massilia antarctica TaxID=2765360 RepID=UPI00351D1768
MVESRPKYQCKIETAEAGQRFQFERHGYFVAARIDSTPGRLGFNRITTLKDSWTK